MSHASRHERHHFKTFPSLSVSDWLKLKYFKRSAPHAWSWDEQAGCLIRHHHHDSDRFEVRSAFGVTAPASLPGPQARSRRKANHGAHPNTRRVEDRARSSRSRRSSSDSRVRRRRRGRCVRRLQSRQRRRAPCPERARLREAVTLRVPGNPRALDARAAPAFGLHDPQRRAQHLTSQRSRPVGRPSHSSNRRPSSFRPKPS